MDTPNKKPSLFKRLLYRVFPVAPDFFSLLNDQCELVVRATAKLAEFMETGDPEHGRAVRRLEHEGDILKARNLETLNQAFATVIDREDIDRAIRSIDEIANYAKSTVREVMAFNVTPDESMAKMACRIHEGSEALRKGYLELARHHADAAREGADLAHKAERRTERVYRHAISNLFDDGRLEAIVADAGPEGTLAALKEVVRMFRRREVYRHLSNTADRVAHAGAILHDTVTKAI